MGRWKRRGGKSQREEKKWESQRGERERRKKMHVREEVGKSRFTVFFQWLRALESNLAKLKRRVRSSLAKWEIKNCTPLWREAHFQVKSVKNPRCQTTFGSCDVEKMHAVVARSTFPSQKCQSWRLRTTFWRSDVEKVYTVVARSTFPSQNVQNATCANHFWWLRCGFAWQAQGIVHLVKSEQNVRVL